MREHSGAEGKNNNSNPTLKELERGKGRTGEAELQPGKREPGRASTARP
jgi:hypothetical protein